MYGVNFIITVTLHRRLFVTRFFTGPLVVHSLLANRRRNDGELRKTNAQCSLVDQRSVSGSQFSGTGVVPQRSQVPLSANIRSMEEEARAKKRFPTPMIYACATMWHENKHEMIQLLKSLFR